MEFDDLINGLLNEPDIEIRRYYPDKLAKLGDWKSTGYLGSIMNNEDEPELLRIECAESLGKQGNPQSVLHLKKAVQSSIIELKRTSIWSLGQIGTPETAEIVMKSRYDKNKMVKKWVIKSLGRINNPICLEYLEDIVRLQFDEYQSLLNLIMISVTQQLRYADNRKMNEWTDRCYDYIMNFEDIVIRQACLKLQNYCFTQKIVPEPNFYKKLLSIVSENDQLLRPYILNNLALAGEFEFLNELELDIFVVKALSKSTNQSRLIDILDQYKKFESAIIEEVLTNLIVEYDCSKFLEIEADGIKYAALHYYARKELEIERILSEIEKGKRLNFLLGLLRYFPNDSFEILKDRMVKGTKAERQTILRVLENIDYIKNQRIIDAVLNLLDEISDKDRIWHIRRDARILKTKITQLVNE